MLVMMQKHDIQARVWFPASITWTAKTSRQMGTASFFIPRSSPAWQSGIVTAKGGHLVEITSGRHIWTGVADDPQTDDEGADITVLEIGEWVGALTIPRARTFRACPAGAIARAAVRDAFSGLASIPVAIGGCVQAAPLIPHYEFTPGMTVQTVLAALQEESGQEWTIDHRSKVFRWQMTTGRHHDGLLVDTGQMFEKIKPGALRDRYREVTEYDTRTRRSFTAWNGSAPPMWPAKTGIDL